MKRSIKLILYIVVIFGIFILNVKAEEVTLPANPKVHTFGSLSNSQYKITDNGNVSAYCMSPNKPHGSKYTLTDAKPESSKYNLALAIAYTRFVNDGKITSKGQSGGIVSATFRLISSYYGKLDTDAVKNPDGSLYNGGTADDDYQLVNNNKGVKIKLKHSGAWTGSRAKYAYGVFQDTINLVRSTAGDDADEKFAALQDSGYLFKQANMIFNVSVTNITEDVGKNKNKKDVTFTISSNASGIDWSKFKKSTNCDSLTSNGNGEFVARVGENVSSFNIEGYYTTIRSVKQKRIYTMKTKSNSDSYQKMILVKSDKRAIKPDITVNLDDKPEETHGSCTIEKNAQGAPTYYDQSGILTNRETYMDQCTHTCETPEENDEGAYYCQNHSNDPDKGGEICSYRQYLEECYCEPYRDTCESNPSDPECAGYADKCPNCNASVSVPGTCNDFDVTSSIKGTISDINKEVTSCNNNVTPVKRCVIEGEDQAGNEYKIAELASNKYCHVYCAEEYTFETPTAQRSTSGGYFNLSLKVSGTRNCYLGNAIDPDAPLNENHFVRETNDLNRQLINRWNMYSEWNALKELIEKTKEQNERNSRNEDPNLYQDEYNNIRRNYEWSFRIYRLAGNDNNLRIESERRTVHRELTGRELDNLEKEATDNTDKFLKIFQSLSKQMDKNINDYTECTKFKNNMNFDPKITFTYKDYSKLLNQNGSGTFTMVGNAATKVEDTYCFGNTNDQYVCTGAKIVTSDDNTVLPAELNGQPTTTSGKYLVYENNHFKLVDYTISKVKWIQKSKTMSATFVPNQNFSTYHQYGTVLTGQNCPNGYNNCLWTRLPDTALPVELKTGKGAFPFTIKFSNIGESNQNESSLGRLIGASNSVLNAFNNLPSNKKCSYNSGKKVDTLTQSTGYVCAYINNCDSCNVTCSGSNCNLIPTCNGDNCPVSCRTCIYDGENTTYKYRTISLNNIFPNSCSKVGYNCRSEGYNWYYQKSGTSTFPVSKKAEATVKEIENLGEKVYEDTYKQYSYTLTPAQLNAIRGYNKAVKSYANTSTNTGANALSCDQVQYNGLNYSVRCKSTFLNDASGTYFTSNIARNNTTKFTLWTETANCPNGNCLSKADGIGPSWK